MTAIVTWKPNCRICRRPLDLPTLDLGLQPLANNLEPRAEAALKARRYPLAFTRCLYCALGQLTHVVAPDALFQRYLYTPSQSAVFRTHFASLAQTENAARSPSRGGRRPFACDIGSNDGLLLSFLKALDWRVLGVDPAQNLAAEAETRGIPTVCGYWGPDAVSRIHSETKGEGADLITACNVLAHTDDWKSFFLDVTRSLAPNGRFVVEVPDLMTMLEDGTFDLIYHEHLSYPSVTALAKVAHAAGLVVTDAPLIPIHGGSLRVTMQREGDGVKDGSIDRRAVEQGWGLYGPRAYIRFAEHAKQAAKAVGDAVRGLRAEGKTVVGYSCPAKASTLIHAAGLIHGEISWIGEDNPAKVNLFMPGTGIEVLPGAVLKTAHWDVAVIWAWNIADELIQRLPRGKTALVPLPTVRIVET